MELKRFKRPEKKDNFKNHRNVVIKGESSGEVKISLIIKMARDYYYSKHNEMFKIMDCGRNRSYIQICADFNVISSCVISTILNFTICHLKYINCIHCYLMSVYFYRYNCLMKSFFCMCLVCAILWFTVLPFLLFPLIFYLFFNICLPIIRVSPRFKNGQGAYCRKRALLDSERHIWDS